MSEDRKDEPVLFNPRPVGEMVNPHVHRSKPEREPDYAAMQRLIKQSAEDIAGKKPQN